MHWFLERANQSIQQLSSALEQRSPDGEEVEGGSRDGDGGLFTSAAEVDKALWTQKTQSEAGDLTWSFSSQAGS